MLNKLKIRFFHLTEFIAAIALAAIFIIFLLQIFTRYAPRISWIIPLPIISDWMNSLQPIGWTVNLISFLWVWIIFFGCSFFVRDREHVVFDLLVFAVPPKIQKIGCPNLTFFWHSLPGCVLERWRTVLEGFWEGLGSVLEVLL